MPQKKANQKGTLASLFIVVMTYEADLRLYLHQILTDDPEGTAFLQLHQKAALLSKDYYNKLAGYGTEGKVAALVEKARSASLKQLLDLLDFIKKKLGDSNTLHLFRHQLQNRPLIPDPPYQSPKSRWDSAVQRQREKSVVLMDRLLLITNEAVKQAKEMKEEKNKSAEATAQVGALQNENNDLREQLENFRNLWAEMEKTKEENAQLTQMAEEVKQSKTSENYKAQADKYKLEAETYKAQADEERKRADDLETELVEVKYELVQSQEEFADQTKELNDKNRELVDTQRKLEENMKQLETALKKIDSLEGTVGELTARLDKQDEENKDTRAAVADLQRDNKRRDSVDENVRARYKLGARSNFDLIKLSLPATHLGKDIAVEGRLPPITGKD